MRRYAWLAGIALLLAFLGACGGSRGPYVPDAAFGDFGLAVGTANPSAAPGTTADVDVVVTQGTAEEEGRAADEVVLGTGALPPGVTAAFSPASVVPSPTGTHATLTFTVSGSAAPGGYQITVTGTRAGVTHTAGLTLTVTGDA
jgi:hypothetical protein